MNGFLYVCGGIDAEGSSRSTAERYDPNERTWKLLPPLLREHCGGTQAVSAGDGLYVCGGRGGGRFGSDSSPWMERFTESIGCWEILPSMRVPRSRFGSVVIAGNIYVFGGHYYGEGRGKYEDGAGDPVECFNIEVGAWSELTRIPYESDECVSVLVSRSFCCA